MDDRKSFYLTALLDYSITNKYLNFILTYIELIELFPFLLRHSVVFRTFYSNNPRLSVVDKYINWSSYFSPFHWYRQLISLDTKMYPWYLVIICFLIFLFFIFLFLSPLFKKQYKDKTISNIKRCVVIIYDNIIFRSLALFVYDPIINHVCMDATLSLLFLTTFFWIIAIFLNIFYVKTFRVCMKFDKNNKYLYDNHYMLICDITNWLVKLMICFSYSFRYEVYKTNFQFFCGILTILILIFNCYSYFSSNEVNANAGVIAFAMLFNFLMFIVLLSTEIIYKTVFIFSFVLFNILLFSLSAIVYTRYRFMDKILKTPLDTSVYTTENYEQTRLKFKILCEYYQLKDFKVIIELVSFTDKIYISQSENISDLSFKYLKFITRRFKIYAKSPQIHSNKSDALFYYTLCKIYQALTSKVNNNLKILFLIYKVWTQEVNNSHIYFWNLRYYYQKFCNDRSFRNGVNLMELDVNYYKLIQTTDNFITIWTEFVSKRKWMTTKSYFKISEDVHTYSVESKAYLSVLLGNNYNQKEDYQKIIFRVIYEGLLNIPFSDNTNTMFSSEEISIYADQLQRTFLNDKQMIVRFDWKSKKNKIIKIGHDLNKILYGKSWDYLFFGEFSVFASGVFYRVNKIRDIAKRYNQKNNKDYGFFGNTVLNNFNISRDLKATTIKPSGTTSTPWSSNNTPQEYFENYNFCIIDQEQNIRSFVYIYRLHSNIVKEEAFTNGYYHVGSDLLIFTENKSDAITLKYTSESLYSILFINQEMINLFKAYNFTVNLFEILSVDGMWSVNKYINYLNDIVSQITLIASKEDNNLLTQLFNYIQQVLWATQIIEYKLSIEFEFKDTNTGRKYTAYSIKDLVLFGKGGKKLKEFRFTTEINILKLLNISSTKVCHLRNNSVVLNSSLFNQNTEDATSSNNKKNMNFNDIKATLGTFSTSSVSVQKTTSNSIIAINKKKIQTTKDYKNNNYLIFIMSLFVCILAIICWIYENILNNYLLDDFVLFDSWSDFNKYLLIGTINWLSHICGYDEKNVDTCVKYTFNYFEQFPQYRNWYKLETLTWEARINALPNDFLNIQNRINIISEDNIQNYLKKEKTTYHFSYNNHQSVTGDLGTPSNYLDISTDKIPLDFFMSKLINKFSLILNNKDWDVSVNYPIIFNNDFTEAEVVKPLTAGLNSHQLLFYEIIIEVVDIANDFYNWLILLDNTIMSRITANSNNLIIFVVGLIVSNALLLLVCLMALLKFNKWVNKKWCDIEAMLMNEGNVKIWNTKIRFITDWTKLFSENPVNLITKIISKSKKEKKKFASMKNAEKKKNDNYNNNNNTINPGSAPNDSISYLDVDERAKLTTGSTNSQYNRSKRVVAQITMKFKIILISLGIGYWLYCGLFIIIYSYSFGKIKANFNLLNSAFHAEEDWLFCICLIQLFDITNISPIKSTGDKLNYLLPNIIQKKNFTNKNNFFTDLFNQIQNNYLEEMQKISLLGTKYLSHNIIHITCDEFYFDIRDTFFETFNNKYPEYQFYSHLSIYCNSISAMTFHDVWKVLNDDLFYRSMNLIFNSQINEISKNVIYNREELCETVTQLFFLYRPWRTFLDRFYYDEGLYPTLDTHFIFWLAFWFGNIFLQIFNFFVIKFFVMKKIDTIYRHWDDFSKVVQCS